MARLAHYVMASEWRAALIASLLLFLPLFSWAGASVVALYALRRGIEKSLLVTAIPMLSASFMAFGFGDPSVLLVLAITIILAAVLYRTLSWISVLLIALGLSLVLVFLVGALYEETLKGLVAAIKEVIAAPAQLAALGVDGVTVDAWMASLSVGALSFVQMTSAIFALIFARAVQAQAFNPGGFKAEFEAVILPRMFAVGCLLLATTGFLIDPWMLRFTPVGALPLMFAGIALVHGLTSMRESRGLIIMFYAALIFFTPYLLMLLALLAVIDAFVDFRAHSRQEPPEYEDK
ncbi:MAG TPA: hypothetical protein DCQ47_07905 [Gammaproteobacteria bacterium]|nr:hypothetical protein [Gammaproteobacteria bacterium]